MCLPNEVVAAEAFESGALRAQVEKCRNNWPKIANFELFYFGSRFEIMITTCDRKRFEMKVE